MKNRLLIIATITTLSVMTSGCKTLDPYSGSSKTSNTTTKAAIGAGIGALIGYVSARDKSSRERRKAMLKGVGVGGLAGAAVGSYMDNQERKLRHQLEGTGVSVTRSGDEVVLNMPGNITFASGKATLNPDFESTLNSVVLVLNEYNQTLIEIAGHTDSVGSAASNQKLAYYRATSVGNYLIDQAGISFDRVMTVGRGEGRPIADNKTKQGRSLNRRVELTLLPILAEAQ